MGRSKNPRIEGLLPRYESGSIYFLKTDTDIQDELIRFPKGVHDDLIDALAYQNEVAKGGYTSQTASQKSDLSQFDYYQKNTKEERPYFSGSLYLRK